MENSKVSPLLVKTGHAQARLWLPCKEAALKSVLWRTPAKEKQIRRGICQLQHFSCETKASVACWKDGQNVLVQTLTIDLPVAKNNCRPCAQIAYLIWLYLIVWERNGGVEFIVCQVFIWPPLKAKRMWVFYIMQTWESLLILGAKRKKINKISLFNKRSDWKDVCQVSHAKQGTSSALDFNYSAENGQ